MFLIWCCQIAHFKIPRYVIFVDRYPLTVSGKVSSFRTIYIYIRHSIVLILPLGTDCTIDAVKYSSLVGDPL